PIMDFVNSSAGQLLLAEAVMAAAGLFAAKQASGTAVGEVLSHPADNLQRAGQKVARRAGDAQDQLARSTARLRFALEEGVRAFREALAQPGMEPADEAPIEEDVEASAKKKNWSGPEATPH
ncbi:MAG TPA: hypothetical protein VFZ95_07045, partial [Steroidobacteraceae bacterium]